MKIDFTIANTDKQTIVKQHKAFIELNPEYIKWVVDYDALYEFDETAIKEECHIFNNLILNRKSIDAIRLFQDAKTKTWLIELEYHKHSPAVDFKNYKEAKDVFDMIVSWRYQ